MKVRTSSGEIYEAAPDAELSHGDTVVNENALEGIRCIGCNNTERFTITATVKAEVRDRGVVDVENFEWDDDSTIECPCCQSTGTVAQFRVNEATPATASEAPAPATTGKKDGDAPQYTERQQFLLDVMVTAFEGGINYWATEARSVERDSECNYLYAEVRDTELAPGEWFAITPEVIELGIKRIIDGDVRINSQYLGWVASSSAENDAGMIDAPTADCIVQAGVFNGLVYS